MMHSFQCRTCFIFINIVFFLIIIPFKGAAGDIATDSVKTEGLGDVKKGPKWAIKERSINKRLFIPNKAEYSPNSLAVQRLHLWLLSCSNYWLAGAFEKSAINPGILKKKQKTTTTTTENCSVFSRGDCNWWGTTEQHTHWCVQSHSKLLEETTCLLFSYFLSNCSSENNCYRWL